jgi:hypothetical protein
MTKFDKVYEEINQKLEEGKFSNLAAAAALGAGALFGSGEDAEAKTKRVHSTPKKIEVVHHKDTGKPSKTLEKKVSLDKIVQLVIKHEGINGGQTPFRITSPAMRRWNKIYGYEIDKDIKKPENKKNFLYLKRESDVVGAVRKVFENYAKNPGKYGMSKSVTLEQALRKFDQTGANGKISFLKRNIPGLDVSKPLVDFI